MEDLRVFERELRNALPHLHDPDFQPSDLLFQVAGLDPDGGSGPLQSRILRAIAELDPGADVPSDSRARRHFESLHVRFVLGLSQEETAERLHMSVRNVQRVQAEATHVLALRLWEGGASAQGRARTPGWRSQMEQELASLSLSAPDATADVTQTITGVLELAHILTSRHGVSTKVAFVQPDLVAALHPTALRQILITALGRLAQHVSAKELTLYATLDGGQVKITITGSTHPGLRLATDELIRDIITPHDTSVDVDQRGSTVFLSVKVPSVGQRTVAVVEDNVDMVHFYQRCTTGTSYRIVHLAQTDDVVDTIAALKPDVVVLDVMLPEIDGWQLLTHLSELPGTRATPVIVCSVVREEALALALGAALFLSKPVQPRRFVQALDQVLHQT